MGTMDDRRFDALTRALRGGLPRRRALQSLAAAALSGSAVRAGRVSAGDKHDCEHFEGVCRKRDDCCVKEGLACINRVCLTCIPEHGQCNHNAQWGNECCGGHKCTDEGICEKCSDADVAAQRKKCKRKKKHCNKGC
jgi:hypothetical protein